MLRWNWQARTIEEGAWTTKHIRSHRCTLTSDGEFFLYHAKGPTDGPFSGFFGGAFAISRLPWLSALTHPDTLGPAGASPSRDALSDGDQKRLWARFEQWPMHVRDEHWPRFLGHGWTSFAIEQTSRFGVEPGTRDTLAAISQLDGTQLAVMALVETGRSNLRYFLISQNDPQHAARALVGVRWAHAAQAGHLLLADDQAMLRVLRFKHKADLDDSPRPVFEHSLKTLTPTPRPSPAWAKAPLSPAS